MDVEIFKILSKTYDMRECDTIKSIKKILVQSYLQARDDKKSDSSIFAIISNKNKKYMIISLGLVVLQNSQEALEMVTKVMPKMLGAETTICIYANENNDVIVELCSVSSHYDIELLRKFTVDGKSEYKKKTLVDAVPKYRSF